MFDNIGRKIKGLAKFICWVGIIFSVIIGICIISYGKMKYGDFFQKEIKATYIIIAFIEMIVGSFLSWLAVILLYGYGELIDKTSRLVELKSREFDITKSREIPTARWPMQADGNVSNKNHWICPRCGKQNPWTTSVCICGAERPTQNTTSSKMNNNERWICPNCGKQNPGYSSVCLCGGQRPKTE